MVRHFERLLCILSVEGGQQRAKPLVESGEQRLVHRHAAVHGHGDGQDLRVFANRLKDLRPHDFVDKLVAPAMSGIEGAHIIEFF